MIGPTRVPSWPTSSRGSQCSAKIRSTPSMAAVGDHVDRAAGLHLLGGLEDQPHPPGQRRRARPARARRRAASRCARRGRRRASRPARSRRTAGRWPPAAAARRGRRAGRRSARRSRRRRPGRCRRAGCAARGRPRSAAGRPARWCGARPGPAPARRAAHGARRRRRTRCSASQESSQAGPLPAPRSTTAGPTVRHEVGVRLQEGHRTPPPLRRPARGASAHTPHPDGGVPSRMTY